MSLLDKKVEVTVVGQRCVYLNDYRFAGAKPYVSENLPQHSFETNLREVIDSFGLDKMEKAVKEMRKERV